MSEATQRRLAAIVSVDVVGYSRLMGADEDGTLRTLRAHRAELIDPLIAELGGRIVKTMGDGLLLEFPSVVAAVQCAIAVQEGMAGSNDTIPDETRIVFRIGVNQGDIIIDGDDILGDGVNVAARLQEIAEPGGVTISRRVYEDVRDRLDVAFQDNGEQSLKNIARPVHVWRWSLAGSGAAAAGATVAVGESVAAGETVADEILPLPDKPSIVVLPFDNMSGDPEQEYFTDGITEDIITDLSRFQGLFVIARNTAFSYKGEKIEVPQVAKDLGVHFVLEGSVRKSGDRVRVTAQLIDGASGSHIWAERYDGKLADVFDLQEDVTRQVVSSVAPQIVEAEADRVTRGERRFDDAHDLAWRAYATFRQGLLAADPPRLDEANEMAHRALALNPKCSVAYQTLCFAYAMQNLYSWGEDPLGAADRALEVAEAAMVALPQSDTAYFCLGLARARKGRFEQAVRDLSLAHELNPNDAFTLHILAWCEATVGDTTAARDHADEALRLSPKDPYVGVSYLSLAMAAFVERDHAEFVGWAERAIQAQPVAPIRRAMMIAYAAEVGDEALARTHLDELNRFAPDFIASLFRGENRLFAKQEHMDLLLGGLRKAGLPE